MTAWQRLMDVGLAWRVGLPVALGIGALTLRPLVERDRRSGIRLAIAFLGLAAVVRLLAVALALGSTTGSASVDLLGAVLLVCGAFALAALLLFDVVLVRLKMRVPSIVRDLVVTVAVLAVVMGMLREHGFDPLSLVTTSAVLTAIIGFALQNTIANLFAGLALQGDRTFGIGDWIRTSNHLGRIVEIKWRSTSIVTKDGNTVIIPNNQLVTSEVENLSKPSGAVRMSVRVGFHYRHPPNDVARVVNAAVRGVPGVLASPASDCFPLEFGESAILYAVRYWIADIESDNEIAGEVQTRIWYAAHRSGFEMPYPMRTVISAERAEERRDAEREREVKERAAALGRIDLFASLTPDDRTFLARGMRRLRFAAGEEVAAQGQPGDSLHLIQSGTVAVHVAVDGVQGEVARLGPGDFLGEMSLVTGEPRNASCVAKTDVTCDVLDREPFRALLETHAHVAEEISAVLARRQLALDGEREELSAVAKSQGAQEKSRFLKHIRAFFDLE